MRAPGGNRTVASPVVSQWQSCHIVKDTPWVDAGIDLSFRTIRGFFGVQCGILRLIVWAKCKRNHLLFDRLISDVRDKRSPFIKYENTGTLSPILLDWLSARWVSVRGEIEFADGISILQSHNQRFLWTLSMNWHVRESGTSKRHKSTCDTLMLWNSTSSPRILDSLLCSSMNAREKKKNLQMFS